MALIPERSTRSRLGQYMASIGGPGRMEDCHAVMHNHQLRISIDTQ